MQKSLLGSCYCRPKDVVVFKIIKLLKASVHLIWMVKQCLHDKIEEKPSNITSDGINKIRNLHLKLKDKSKIWCDS